MAAIVDNARKDYLRRVIRWEKEIPYEDALSAAIGGSYEMDGLAGWNGNFEFQNEWLSEAFYNFKLLKQRILTLSFVYRLTAQEIADSLGCTVEYVYRQKHLLLKKLRDAAMEGGEKREKQ